MVDDAATSPSPVRPSGEIGRLLEIMAALRDPETGCPWDLRQDSRSIAPYTLEEAFEVADAIERDSMADLCDELGDLLLQVVFHAQMASERRAFGFADVVYAITSKMIRRHPHVFGEAGSVAGSSRAGKMSWDEVKAQEREHRSADSPLSPSGRRLWLDDVPAAMPAMMLALKLQARAAQVGFDWTEPEPILAKIEEEIEEFREARRAASKAEAEAEFGDLLFSLVNLARHLDIDPESALRRTNTKFRTRFGYIETELRAAGSSLQAASLGEMEALWQKAKTQAVGEDE